jgi:hypothetical protein
MKRFWLGLWAIAVPLWAQAPEKRINPEIRAMADAISPDRITATLHKLEGFGTRNVMSAGDDQQHGIGAAKRWIHDELQSYSPRLQVSYQDFRIPKGSRQGQLVRDADVSNIIAVLPGGADKDHYVLVSAHYDSLAIVYKPYEGPDQLVAEAVRQGTDEAEYRRYLAALPAGRDLGPRDHPASADAPIAPGVTDDGSGTAAVMELARVMSGQEFDKTIVFAIFAGEETGLSGSSAYSAMAKKAGMQIEAVLNNDIIGSVVAGNGKIVTDTLRLFAAGPEDSGARELGRYMKEIAERYEPAMHVQTVFRQDRFLRGGDHTPFLNQGYSAVRLTSAAENYEQQHTVEDTFEHTSVPYIARVARMNLATAASLALAPAVPVLNWTWNSGPNKGGHVPLLGRGKSGYDAVLRWMPNPESDIAGYAVVLRDTTSPVWQREVWVGNVTTYTMPDLSIDDIVIGVKAIDKDGNASLVAPYTEPVVPSMLNPGSSK